MRVLFNCTTNVIGGPVQNATNFIIRALKDTNVDYYVAMSRQVAINLDRYLDVDDIRHTIFEKSPSKSLKSRRLLRSIEDKFSPDIVYTMAGPAFVNFKSLHLLGCSNPYVSFWEPLFVNYDRGLAGQMLLKARTAYQEYWFRRADFWMFQTESSAKGFSHRLDVSFDKLFVVANSLGAEFDEVSYNDNFDIIDKKVRILIPSADYPHKALKIIPSVAKSLKILHPEFEFIFTLTIDKQNRVWRNMLRESIALGVDCNIVNIGPYKYCEARGLYDSHHIVCLPSILEVFSTSYLEAMAAGKPLVVSDLVFARDICQNAAYYAKPLCAESFANGIVKAAVDRKYAAGIKRNGFSVLKKYGDYGLRYRQIINVLTELTSKKLMDDCL